MNHKLNVILTGTPSDSHTWNLIFMELWLKENNCQVRNLGACVSTHMICQEIKKLRADLVVVSSINGHLFQDGINIINDLSQRYSRYLPPIVIGGKLGISTLDLNFQKKKLIKLGYDGVFAGKDSLSRFQKYLRQLEHSKYANILKHAL